MAVATGFIVEDFDVIEDVSTRQVAGFVNALANPLLLQAAEEGLRYSVIPATPL